MKYNNRFSNKFGGHTSSSSKSGANSELSLLEDLIGSELSAVKTAIEAFLPISSTANSVLDGGIPSSSAVGLLYSVLMQKNDQSILMKLKHFSTVSAKVAAVRRYVVAHKLPYTSSVAAAFLTSATFLDQLMPEGFKVDLLKKNGVNNPNSEILWHSSELEEHLNKCSSALENAPENFINLLSSLSS